MQTEDPPVKVTAINFKDSATQSAFARLPRKPAYRQALELQELIMQDARAKATTPSARAQLARAWQALEDQKRELRCKPKAGQYKSPEHPRHSRKPKALPPPIEEA